jgi:hypothetical protein
LSEKIALEKAHLKDPTVTFINEMGFLLLGLEVLALKRVSLR